MFFPSNLSGSFCLRLIMLSLCVAWVIVEELGCCTFGCEIVIGKDDTYLALCSTFGLCWLKFADCNASCETIWLFVVTLAEVMCTGFVNKWSPDLPWRSTFDNLLTLVLFETSLLDILTILLLSTVVVYVEDNWLLYVLLALLTSVWEFTGKLTLSCILKLVDWWGVGLCLT